MSSHQKNFFEFIVCSIAFSIKYQWIYTIVCPFYKHCKSQTFSIHNAPLPYQVYHMYGPFILAIGAKNHEAEFVKLVMHKTEQNLLKEQRQNQ